MKKISAFVIVSLLLATFLQVVAMADSQCPHLRTTMPNEYYEYTADSYTHIRWRIIVRQCKDCGQILTDAIYYSGGSHHLPNTTWTGNYVHNGSTDTLYYSGTCTTCGFAGIKDVVQPCTGNCVLPWNNPYLEEN